MRRAFSVAKLLANRAQLIGFLPLALAGCGHPATVSDCEAIVERITQLELKKRTSITDHKLLQREVAETKNSLRARTMKECVGRRITDRAMRCVREAQTSKQIIEDCFD